MLARAATSAPGGSSTRLFVRGSRAFLQTSYPRSTYNIGSDITFSTLLPSSGILGVGTTLPSPIGGSFVAPSSHQHQSFATFSKSKKKQDKKKKAAEEDQFSGKKKKDEVYDMLVRCYEAPMRKPPQASPEEMERRKQVVKAYTVGMYERHNRLYHDLTCKLRMKNLAVQMLPRETRWKEEALKITVDGPDGIPPVWRRIPTDTPPIPGYDPSDWTSTDD